MKKIITGIILIIVLVVFYMGFSFYLMCQPTTGKPIGRYANPRQALLVIDLQRALTEPGWKMVLNTSITDSVIENINLLLDKNRDMLVIYVRHESVGALANLLNGNTMKHGNPGTDFDTKLKIINSNIFTKHIPDSFSNPELDTFLIKNSVNHLYITGVDARYCIDRTTRGAFNRGYTVTVIKDAIGSKSDDIVNRQIDEFRKLGAEITTTGDLLKKIQH